MLAAIHIGTEKFENVRNLDKFEVFQDLNKHKNFWKKIIKNFLKIKNLRIPQIWRLLLTRKFRRLKLDKKFENLKPLKYTKKIESLLYFKVYIDATTWN